MSGIDVTFSAWGCIYGRYTVAGGELVFLNNSSLTLVNRSVDSQVNLYTLTLFNNTLFSGTGPNGNLLQDSTTAAPYTLGSWNGTTFAGEAELLNNLGMVQTLSILAGVLYGGGGTIGQLQTLSGVTALRPTLMEWNGTTFTDVGSETNGVQQILSLAEISGTLYGAGGTAGSLLEYS